MSGVPQPPVVIIPFGADATDPAYITLPIPIDSQISTTPGAASFTDGFPPLTMSDPDTQGGVPPFGQDMNGLLYTLSAFCAMLQAGQLCEFNDEAQYAWGGYPLGALLRKVDGTGFWFNVVDGNDTDPDAAGAGWIGWSPAGVAIGYVAANVPAGTSHNYAPTGFGPSTNTLDLTASGGAATVDGFGVGQDGQRIVVTNLAASSDTLTLAVLTGSGAANQLRGPTDITLLPGFGAQIQYSVGAGKWLLLV